MNIGNGIDSLAQITAQETVSSSTNVKAIQNSSQDSNHGLNGSLIPGTSDQAHLSSAASQLSGSADSDVRLDKVASIQSAIQAGTYHVDAADVAKKVVSALLSSEG